MPVSTPTGRVVREGDRMVLELTRRMPEPVEDVWDALTEPDRTPGWIGSWSGDPSAGTIDFTMTAEGVTEPHPIVVRECLRPTLLGLDMPSPDGTWPVTVELTPTGSAGTILRFSQVLAEPYDASSIGPGWHYYLDRMVAVLRGQEPPTAWEDYYPATAGAYAIPE